MEPNTKRIPTNSILDPVKTKCSCLVWSNLTWNDIQQSRCHESLLEVMAQSKVSSNLNNTLETQDRNICRDTTPNNIMAQQKMFSCFWARPAPPPPLLKEWWKVPLTVAYMILGMALCWELAYKKDMIKNDINVNKHYQYLQNVCQHRWKQNPQTHSPFNLNNFIKDYFNPWLTSWNSPSIAPQHAPLIWGPQPAWRPRSFHL